MIKNILILTALFFLMAGKISAGQADFLIINQIRGEEQCCQKGQAKLIEDIVNNKKINKSALGWALRYDVLNNDQMLGLVINSGELGILLEITPRLAFDSKVSYKGKLDGSDWHYARNSFLAGYTVDERKKMIDYLFISFKNKIGYYPSFTAAWMIDSWSLNYIYNQYGVRLHELTKEQYETDSYTLYGGIFNAPFYPLAGHPLIPGNETDKLKIVIVRQTVSDLLKNYGSPKAYFTSQPNDYLSSKERLDFSYFQQLTDDVLKQSSELRFGVLGFENSFPDEKYTSEYLKQLEYINLLQSQGKLRILRPTEFASEFERKYKENPAFYLQKDFSPEKNLGVLWYFGKTYRARLLLNKGKVTLDDLRIYSKIGDPYRDVPISTDYSYWIVPYLIDGSQQYQSLNMKSNNNQKELIGDNTTPDYMTDPFGIVLGRGKFKLHFDDTSIEIEFDGENQGKIKLLPQEINIGRTLNPYLNLPTALILEEVVNRQQKTSVSFAKHFDFVVNPFRGGASLGWEREGKFIDLASVNIEKDLIKLIPINQVDNIKLLDPIFQPDRSGLSVDAKKSIFYWNNKTAIAGRNPLRLFILPLNNLGRPSQVKKIEVISPDINNLEVIYPDDYSFRIKPWFIDITAKNPLDTQVTVIADGVTVGQNIPIKFITDCKKNFGKCLKNPRELFYYLKNIIF